MITDISATNYLVDWTTMFLSTKKKIGKLSLISMTLYESNEDKDRFELLYYEWLATVNSFHALVQLIGYKNQ